MSEGIICIYSFYLWRLMFLDNNDNKTREQQEVNQGILDVQESEQGDSTAQSIVNTIDVPLVREKNTHPRSYKRPSGLSYFATALVGAVIGGVIVAAIVPSYLYDKLAPMQQPGACGSHSKAPVAFHASARTARRTWSYRQ